MLKSLRAIPALGTVSRRAFSTGKVAKGGLRIGYVPEHFSTPLHFAQKYFGLNATLTPFPAGTGHMISSLKASEIDVGIGLTEGWVAGLAKAAQAQDAAPYKLVGTYVESPLLWAISTGKDREFHDVGDLKGKKVGVSRIGSGSYVMPFVLADQHSWLRSDGHPPFEAVPLETFAKLRDGVNDKSADFFMWEHFTTKKYWDNGSIKRLGEVATPWSSWKIVARDPLDKSMQAMSDAINAGILYFNEHQQEAVDYISTELDYSKEDAEEWTKTVEFAKDVRGVDPKVVEKTIQTLGKAGVLDAQKVDVEDMVAIKRSSRGSSP
ncbi:hypothetical protein B0A49_06161 [Cryomyces minteri]|uniref:Ca3427-like PBP 2 domain-containing protein n=1 Tax=Cryomyces minteri TaxID=331657 RepID=A0A4U0X195_9PEZI|nr:hypothetical protein B0A49_06161 [Cryomyces minteri]